MAYTPDVSNDYTWWDAVETVLVNQRDETDSVVPVTDVTARRESFAANPQGFAEMNIPPEAVIWLLPAGELGGEVPRQGTEIIDSNDKAYLVETVQERRVGSSLSHYVCGTFARRK